jgi:hypothetical protein
VKQALHIFKKDAHYLRNELCVVAGLAIISAWAATRSPNPMWAEVLLAVAAAYLTARLIHAETIPGDRQFWITRPYRWSSLLAAKLLGLIVFVNLPILAARLYVLMAAGFPLRTILAPLMWSQLVIFVGATVPVAALAAVTPGIVPFTFAVLILLACGFGIEESISPPTPSAVRLGLTGAQWVWDSIAVFTLAAFAVPVLYFQYRKRWTALSRGVILSAAAVGALAYMYVPWPVAAAIQAGISKRSFDVRGVEVSFAPDAKQFFGRVKMWRGTVQVDVPIAVRGIPADVEPIPDAVALRFEADDGSSWSTGPYDSFALGKRLQGRGPTILNANVDVPIEFFNHAIRQRVKVKGALYLTMFGNPRSRTIPIGSTPVDVLDGLQCSIGNFSIGEFDVLSCGAGVRDIKVRAVGSCGASLRPEIFEPLIEPAAAQSDDGVGAS